ncbi:MAG: hypothetical protein ABSG18_18645 [Steroidobacteraceae bacterium]|jgi:hypothetical protein
MNISIALKTLLGTAALTLPLMASAASTYTTGTGTLTAAAQVDFSVVIPQILYLRVGTGSSYTTGSLTTVSTVDLITFSPTAAQVGTPAVVAGTGGDIGAAPGTGIETAAVVGNGGSITLTASANANGLSNGASTPAYIPFTTITTTPTTLTSTTALPAPALSNGTSTETIPATNGVVSMDAKWTYTYSNSSTVAAGTYGGVNTNNSRVTYTATML